MNSLKKFIKKHKIISFLIIFTLTIIITRVLTYIKDPDRFIKGIELPHFYYGLIILIITSILMLYKKGNFHLHLILTALSIGLIVDELFFITLPIRNSATYPPTLPPVGIISIILILIIFFIFYCLKQSKT